MTSTTYDRTTAPVVHDDPTRRPRRILLLVNGGFLTVVGALQMSLELLSYYTGAGPYGADFDASPYTIGWVEAHGLALLIGLLFLLVASDGRRSWHVFAIGVHLLLGTANLVFWSSFVHFGMVPMGIAATVAHALFVLAHLVALAVSRSPQRSTR
jgi:hypothetical protein